MKNNFKMAVCQMNVVDDKELNLDKANKMISEASKNGAELVVLPEMFNCPYDTSKFRAYAESMNNSISLKSVSNAAADGGVYLVAGSIPELLNGKLYNSCFIFDMNGEVINIHRKMHLFDINLPNEITFKESEIITAGNNITVFETDLAKIGVAICYDIRFPELFRLMTMKGAELFVVPGAFNMTTGPAHWETTIRARAVDNQTYMAVASPSHNIDMAYIAYGHSMVVDPWGNIIAKAGEDEEIIYATIDKDYIYKVRNELPLLKNRRTDIYELFEINKK
jgi:omega-amidase